MHVFLSPHFDDAALSCGGWIHALAAAGQPARVATLCAGDPPAGPLSAFAQELHQRWDPAGAHAGDPAFMVRARAAEDLAAMRRLHVPVLHLPTPDCIYRRGPEGEALYPSVQAIFGALHPADEPLVQSLARELAALAPDGCLVTPLGLGNHVDHQLARRAAERSGRPLMYYEDYPYATGEAGLPAAGAPGPDRTGLQPHVQPLAEADLQAKLDAIRAYRSQINSFWPDEAAMQQAVRRFAAQTGGERLWRPA